MSVAFHSVYKVCLKEHPIYRRGKISTHRKSLCEVGFESVIIPPMAENANQTHANHTRWDPVFHYFLLPVFGVSIVLALVNAFHHPGFHAVWIVVVAVAAFLAVGKMRGYALRVQDRVIRLEERLRLATTPTSAELIRGLTEEQLIALRFASDDELPELAYKALAQRLSGKEIKKLIRDWRPDLWRV